MYYYVNIFRLDLSNEIETDEQRNGKRISNKIRNLICMKLSEIHRFWQKSRNHLRADAIENKEDNNNNKIT